MATPLPYDDDTAERICELIAEGRSLVSICKEEGMPGYSTVMKWLRLNREFAQNYAHARDAQSDFLAEEIVDISDDSGFDYKKDDDGNVIVNGDAIQRARLRVDARKWYAGKLQPKKYGDKTLHTGPEGNEPAVFTLNIGERAKAD